MLGFIQIVTLYIFLNLIFSIKARRGLQRKKEKMVLAKLRAVLYKFGSSKNLIVDSAQANTAESRIFCEYLRENELYPYLHLQREAAYLLHIFFICRVTVVRT